MPSRKNKGQKKSARISSNGRRVGVRCGFERTYNIVDYRLEKPEFTLTQVRKGDGIEYAVEGDLGT
ncbi:MAG TPA: hypothetical protein VEI49_14090, partial [Terriglobales bacterium]|nr:hypothetical protein [Terriglobales bacterium]